MGILNNSGVFGGGGGSALKLLGTHADLTESWTDIISADDWAAVPSGSLCQLLFVYDHDNYKSFTTSFRRDDVSTTARWLGNIDDYDSGRRIELKLSSNKVQARRQASGISAQNRLDIYQL